MPDCVTPFPHLSSGDCRMTALNDVTPPCCLVFVTLGMKSEGSDHHHHL